MKSYLDILKLKPQATAPNISDTTQPFASQYKTLNPILATNDR